MFARIPFLVLLVLLAFPSPSTYLQHRANKAVNQCEDCERRLTSLQARFDGLALSSRRACEEKTRAITNDLKNARGLLGSGDEKTRAINNDLKNANALLSSCKAELNTSASSAVRLHACESRINNSLLPEIARVTKLYEAELAEKVNLNKQYAEAARKNNDLIGQNSGFVKAIDDLKSRLGTEGTKYADLFERSKKIENHLSESKVPETPPQLSQAITVAPVETYRKMLEADDIKSQTPSNKAPAEYKTVIENGTRYQVRELMIGSLYFPDPSTLVVAPSQPLDIEVKFKPNALLKNSTSDGNTKWFLEFAFAPDKLKDFGYDGIRSHDKERRLVGDEPEETWIWKIDKDKIPDSFSKDTPHIQIDASAEVDGQEISRKTIENRPLDIKEKPVPGFFATIFQGIVNYSTLILLLTTAGFGVGTAWFGFQKARLETEMKKVEARNNVLSAEVDKPGSPGVRIEGE